MFKNIASKLKTIAQVIVWVFVAAGLIIGMTMAAHDFSWVIAGPITGFIIGCLNGLILYAFGQLVENTDEIKRSIVGIEIMHEKEREEDNKDKN